MPLVIEHITAIVIAIIAIVVAATLLFVFLAVGRRRRRDAYFERLDELRQQFQPVVRGLLEQRLDYNQGIAKLRQMAEAVPTSIVEQLTLEKKPTPEQLPLLRRVCEDLGLVKLWQARLTGERSAGLREASWADVFLQRVARLQFLERARSGENLAAIKHQASWPLLVKALDDPHPDVRLVAIRALAAICEPQSFPVLVQRLQAVVLDPENVLSLRAVKTAVVSFPLPHALDLRDSLRHKHRRVRFLATDSIREMVEKAAAGNEDFYLEPGNFNPELAELFLNHLTYDENPDVRARAAPVIAYLRDTRAVPVLLGLLEDQEWFVRMHTVRAMAKRRFQARLPNLAQRLTDPNWMVREAAVRLLSGFDRAGAEQLFEHFLGTQDRYSREQIADEWQRAGVIPGLMLQYAQADGRLTSVVEQLAFMGKTSYLVGVLLGTPDRDMRKKFLQDFGRHPDPQIRAWVEHLRKHESDPELRALAQAVPRSGSGR